MLTIGLYFSSRLQYGLIGQSLTGSTLVSAALVYAILHRQAGPILKIPFEEGSLELSFGWCFGMVLGTGLLCIFGSVIMWVFFMTNPLFVINFLGLSTVDDSDVRSPGTVPSPLLFANKQAEKKEEGDDITHREVKVTRVITRSSSLARPGSMSFLRSASIRRFRRPRKSEMSFHPNLAEDSPQTPKMLVNDVVMAAEASPAMNQTSSLVIQQGLTSPRASSAIFFPTRSPSPITKPGHPHKTSSSSSIHTISPRSFDLSPGPGGSPDKVRHLPLSPKLSCSEYHELKTFDCTNEPDKEP